MTQFGSARTINMPSQQDLSASKFTGPDIVLARSIFASSEQIRKELRLLGMDGSYESSLRVILTQGQMVAGLAGELLARLDTGKARE